MRSKAKDLEIVKNVGHRFVDKNARKVYVIASFFNVTLALLDVDSLQLYFLIFSKFSSIFYIFEINVENV